MDYQTKSKYEFLKDLLLLFGLVILIGYILSLIGITGGSGGNPQESYKETNLLEQME